jgi:hypothetical protein
MKNYFWWKSVTFSRMARQYVTTVKQESFSILSFLQDGLGVEEGQRLIGCGGKAAYLSRSPVRLLLVRYSEEHWVHQ